MIAKRNHNCLTIHFSSFDSTKQTDDERQIIWNTLKNERSRKIQNSFSSTNRTNTDKFNIRRLFQTVENAQKQWNELKNSILCNFNRVHTPSRCKTKLSSSLGEIYSESRSSMDIKRDAINNTKSNHCNSKAKKLIPLTQIDLSICKLSSPIKPFKTIDISKSQSSTAVINRKSTSSGLMHSILRSCTKYSGGTIKNRKSTKAISSKLSTSIDSKRKKLISGHTITYNIVSPYVSTNRLGKSIL